MIIGAHTVLYSTNPEADRSFFRDILNFPHVDAGRGWLIFALPPAEIAVHPADARERSEIYLMCDDIEATIRDLEARGVPCSAISRQRWGHVTQITLPGGGQIGVYQPTHPVAIAQ